MKKIFLFLFFINQLFGWGFDAHKIVQSEAIKILPENLKPFFEKNKILIIDNSIAPDKWRNQDKKEAPRHYIDFDRYGKYPFTEVPEDFQSAIKKFGIEKINENGTLPWRVLEFTEKLTEAFKNKNENDILFYASALGHYIADANVPLHSTENYNGQLTGQDGLHSRWESDLPKKFETILNPQKPIFIKDKSKEIFGIIKSSFLLVDDVLQADELAKYDEQGNPNFNLNKKGDKFNYSKNYYTKFYFSTKSDLVSQMEKSAHFIASFWYTAWVNAGEPKL